MLQIRKFRESLTSIVFHVTNVESCLDILKTNKFTLATNLGTGSDKIGSSKFYYMSFSTIKYGGYNRSLGFSGQTILVIDGAKLNQRYKGTSVDYWGVEWRKAGDSVKNPAEQMYQQLRNDENEERLVTDNPEIPNALQYIKEIHVCITDEEITDRDKQGTAYYDYREGKFRLDQVKRLAEAHNIPIYFYTSPKAFMNLDKRKILDYGSSGGYINAVIQIYNHYLGKKINDIPNEYPMDGVRRALWTVKQAEQNKKEWQDQEFLTQIQNDIHNGKSSDEGRVRVANLTRIMQKEKVRTLWDLMKAIAA